MKNKRLVVKSVALAAVFAFLSSSTIAAKTQELNDYGTVLRSLPSVDPGVQAQEVMIYAQENEKADKKIARKGHLTFYPDARATVLIAHGYMCCGRDVGFLRSMLSSDKKHYNFMTFDFRGHGEQGDGQCCTFGRDEAYDVIAAAKFLKNHPATKNKPLFVYAFSMGAVASIEAQAKEKLFDAMILDCPFDASENIVKTSLASLKLSLFGYNVMLPGHALLEKYAFHPYVQSTIMMLLKSVAHVDHKRINTFVYRFTPAQSAQKIEVPCFFIHCKNDEKITVAEAKNIFSHAAGPKQLWITNGRHHYDSFFYNPEEYAKRIGTFMDQVLMGQWTDRSKQLVMEDRDNDLIV